MRRFGDILPVALALTVLTFLALRAWELIKAVWQSPWLILVILALIACGLLTCCHLDVVRRWRGGSASREFSWLWTRRRRNELGGTKDAGLAQTARTLMNCEICGNENAVVHLTEIRSGVMKQRHLCAPCAAKESGMTQGSNKVDVTDLLKEFVARHAEWKATQAPNGPTGPSGRSGPEA
jgi:hypothetical protein